MPSSSQRVLILGSSFAGLTAALEVRKRLDARHEIVVLDPRDHFTFIPSLIWLPLDDRFRHRDHPDVYAAGVAIAIAPPHPTKVPAGSRRPAR